MIVDVIDKVGHCTVVETREDGMHLDKSLSYLIGPRHRFG